jgi:hypothetical protein
MTNMKADVIDFCTQSKFFLGHPELVLKARRVPGLVSLHGHPVSIIQTSH